MLLAVDVGNSHTVFGIFNHLELIKNWRIQTDRNCTADELAEKIHVLFILEKISFADIQAVIISSVVPPVKAAWQACVKKYFHIDPLFVSSAIKTGIKIKIDNPAEAGADRIVNSVAAFARHNRPLIIVDFGTAITFDCISAKGEYIGGAIAPGLAISLAALGRETSKLPAIDISTPPVKPIGANTVDAIKSGILHGYGGLVEGIIKEIKKEFAPDDPHVMATGGMAGLIAPFAPSIKEVDVMLTLKGLRLIYEKNK